MIGKTGWPRRGWLLLVAAWLVGSILPPSPARGKSKTFEDRTDVIEVQVPVNVYMRNGEPVRGLTAEDFEIFDRGDRQAITGFRMVDLEILQPKPGYDPADIVPAAARRHFLLLFDLTFSGTAAIIKAREAAQEFVLNHLHATDLVAVATFSSDIGPRLVVTFTPDRAQLARAIQTLGAPRLNDVRVDPLRFVLARPQNEQPSAFANRDFNSNQVGGFAPDRKQVLNSYLQVINKQFDKVETTYQRGRVSSWAAGLKGLAQVLASAEGRKHVVLFSEGFDGRLMLGRGPDANDPDIEMDQIQLQYGQYAMVDMDQIYGNSSLQKDVDVMLEEFRRADCVIQAVDISGLDANFNDNRRAQQVGQDALFYIANETGGSLFEDANNFSRQLVDVLRQTSVTYVLHFIPSGLESDGTYHKLQVKLRERNKGQRIAHRAGYYAPRPFKDLHPLEKNLLASDAIAAAAPRQDVALNVLAAAFRANPETAYVPVIVEVDGSTLLAGQDPRKQELAVELYTYVTDDNGEMRDFFTQLITLDLGQARAPLKRSGLKYYGHLDLPQGSYLVRVLVRNAQTGRAGVKTARVVVPRYELAEPDLLPPFFLEPPERQWVMVRERRSDANGYQKSVVYPFTLNGSPFVPAARPKLALGQGADLCLVAYNLPAGKIEIAGTILGADGHELAGGKLAMVERTVTGIQGLDKLLATFQPENLSAGEYTLRVAVGDTAAGTAQVNTIPFTITN